MISEIRNGVDKAYLFVAVVQTSKLVHARLYRQMTRSIVAFFSKRRWGIACRVHTMLADNGVQSCGNPPDGLIIALGMPS